MELRAILLAGVLASFVASALNSFLWIPLFQSLSRKAGPPAATLWRPFEARLHLVSLFAHVVAGVSLGFLFWVSWGLTAIVSVPWWQRGSAFGLITWFGIAGPLLLSQIASARVSGPFLLKSAIEWLSACTLIGLWCAYQWGGGR
ncbi:MAG TPA: hypothetical protein VK629_11255 [Steroidobacteraceae bacterium]|nr:hypothetical protein [Steroidobacteraceae bacterium]